MIFVKPSHEILTDISEGGIKELKLIEKCARVSYRSEDKITEDGESAKKMVAMLIKNGHESCLEHSILTVVFICDRAIANELVRHRITSPTQESTRYVNVKAEKLGANGEMQVILPEEFEFGEKIYDSEFDGLLYSGEAGEVILPENVYNYAHKRLVLGYIYPNEFEEFEKYYFFLLSVMNAESSYTMLNRYNVPVEIARGVLPLSLATKIVMTANYREWRYIFKLRCDSHAHPEMRRIMIPLLHEVQEKIPVVFDDIKF